MMFIVFLFTVYFYFLIAFTVAIHIHYVLRTVKTIEERDKKRNVTQSVVQAILIVS